MTTPYQRALLDARLTLTLSLAAQGFPPRTVEGIIKHHADICELLQQYQRKRLEAYTEQQLVEFGPSENKEFAPGNPPGVREFCVKKTYIGDGVYVSFNGYQFEVITSDGRHATNTIYLEFGVFENLARYVENVKTTLEKNAP